MGASPADRICNSRFAAGYIDPDEHATVWSGLVSIQAFRPERAFPFLDRAPGRDRRRNLKVDEMKRILHVSCSPRGRSAESYSLAEKIIACLMQVEPTATVVERSLSDEEIPHVDADYAINQQSSVDITREGSMKISEELIQELESSDFVVIGTPMHNFTVPSALKAWIDHIVRVRRTFDVSPAGKIALLRDRPVFIAVSSGGKFSGERSRQPDFLTPYLEAILGMIGLHDLTFFSVQGTASRPDAVAIARSGADRALQDHFSSYFRNSLDKTAA